MKKLRIATMVSGHFTTPPPQEVIYAPMQIAVDVAQGLAKRGHEITFFAPEGSRIEGVALETAGLLPLKSDGGLPIMSGPSVGGGEIAKIFNLWDQYLVAKMYQRAREERFDLFHFHPVDRAIPFALAIPDIPVAYTLHDPIYPWRAEVFRMFQTDNQYYISISDAQRKPAPDLNYAATVYNGMRLDDVPLSLEPEDHLIFVGRLTKEKGVAEAIEVAQKLSMELIIMGVPAKGSYWDSKIKPNLGDSIRYGGILGHTELYKAYGRAKVTLVPIQWEEPFGLVIIESMACGTPVIAFRRGSVPEIVRDGVNGFIVDTVDEMVEAVKKIDTIDRAACRAYVEQHFSIEKMVDSYERVFHEIVEKHRRK